MKPELVHALKMLKQKYSAQGFHIIGIFGSQARGDSTAESDLDILFEIDENFRQAYNGFSYFEKYAQIKSSLEESLKVKVDLAMKSALKPYAKEAILKELLYV